MWQRFTERARRVVFFAQEEATRQGENYVSTEHLLLGLIREDDSVAARILIKMNISLDSIREDVQKQVTQGKGNTGQDMQLTPRAKRVVDLAYDEARMLSNNYIGTEHLMLGLIREAEGMAGKVLATLGVDLERTREEIRVLQQQPPRAVPATASGPAGAMSRAAESEVEPIALKGDIGVLWRHDSSAEVQLVIERTDIPAYEEVMDSKDDYAYREMVAAGKIILLAPGTQAKFLHKEGSNSDCVRILDGEHAGKRGYVRRGYLHDTHADDRPFPPVI